MNYHEYINSDGKLYKLVSRKVMLRGGKERPIYYFKPYDGKLASYEHDSLDMPEGYGVIEDNRHYPRVIKRGISENN